MLQPRPRPGAPLGPLLEAIVPAPGVASLLVDLAAPDLALVTTGQQAGLFTGPLYTIHKALSAAALASELSRRWNRTVRPLFWIAGDDHDFAEAASTSWVTPDGSLHCVELEPRPPEAPMLPMYREPLGPPIEALLESFLNGIPEAPHRDHVCGWLSRHYRPGTTIAGAYAGALAELLAPFGVACLDSTHPAFKRAAAPFILKALAATDPLDLALSDVAARYAEAGEAAPVVVGEGASLVFLEDRLGRDRLVRKDGGFITRRGNDSYSLEQLTAVALAEPERLSASVLLRPVLESAMLPTVAYVGGPGELRYLGMTAPVYQQLDTWTQLPVPRWSGVIVEPHVDRILAKFGTTVDEVIRDAEALEQRLIRAQLPESVSHGLVELDRMVGSILDRIGPAALEIDPTLSGPIANSRRRMDWARQDLEVRILRRLRVRESVDLAQLRRVRGTIHPGGNPQERVLTVAPFLALHGPQLLTAILEEAQAWYAAALEGPPPPA